MGGEKENQETRRNDGLKAKKKRVVEIVEVKEVEISDWDETPIPVIKHSRCETCMERRDNEKIAAEAPTVSETIMGLFAYWKSRPAGEMNKRKRRKNGANRDKEKRWREEDMGDEPPGPSQRYA